MHNRTKSARHPQRPPVPLPRDWTASFHRSEGDKT